MENVNILYIYLYVCKCVIHSFFLRIRNNLEMFFQGHGLFFAGNTYVDKIANQDHDESSETRPDASRLGW